MNGVTPSILHPLADEHADNALAQKGLVCCVLPFAEHHKTGKCGVREEFACLTR